MVPLGLSRAEGRCSAATLYNAPGSPIRTYRAELGIMFGDDHAASTDHHRRRQTDILRGAHMTHIRPPLSELLGIEHPIWAVAALDAAGPRRTL